MDWDEVRPVTRTSVVTIGEDLSTLSVGELEARVAALEAEILRVKTEIAAKRAHESAAAQLFKR